MQPYQGNPMRLDCVGASSQLGVRHLIRMKYFSIWNSRPEYTHCKSFPVVTLGHCIIGNVPVFV